MKQKVSPGVIAITVLLVVGVIALIGFKTMGGSKGGSTGPVPDEAKKWMDPGKQMAGKPTGAQRGPGGGVGGPGPGGPGGGPPGGMGGYYNRGGGPGGPPGGPGGPRGIGGSGGSGG